VNGFRTRLLDALGRSSRPLLEVYYCCRYLFFNCGSARQCPCCDSHLRRFLPAIIGSEGVVNGIRCPRCDSHPRHRVLWLYFTEHLRDLFAEPLSVLHVAPEFCFLRRFRTMPNLRYFTGDLSSPFADARIDLTSLPFAAETFDVVICNHVLEHVHDDRKALRELYRVLKPGGWGILQVPVDKSREATFEDWSITTVEGRTRHFGQHDHVRQYGADYPERLREAGFAVNTIDFLERFEPERRFYFGLEPAEPIYICVRPVTG
jgi:SAM-dependent methyltransferase